jgi:hypothetical protein
VASARKSLRWRTGAERLSTKSWELQNFFARPGCRSGKSQASQSSTFVLSIQLKSTTFSNRALGESTMVRPRTLAASQLGIRHLPDGLSTPFASAARGTRGVDKPKNTHETRESQFARAVHSGLFFRTSRILTASAIKWSISATPRLDESCSVAMSARSARLIA